MIRVSKFVDFSFKMFQGLSSYVSIILTSSFLTIEEYSYLSVLGIILVSICTIDLGFNTKLINSYLSTSTSSTQNLENSSILFFFQILNLRKYTILKIFLFQVILLAITYLVLQESIEIAYSLNFFLVTLASLFVMYLGARLSTYLIALGKARTLFQFQGLGAIIQLFAIFSLGQVNSNLVFYIPVLALPNLIVMFPIFRDWTRAKSYHFLMNEAVDIPVPSGEHLSLVIQTVQFLQLMQGFAIPLILTRLFDELTFAAVITQYRMCIALFSSVGTLALTEWSSISQDETDRLRRDYLFKVRYSAKLLERYFLLLCTIIVSLPLFATLFWQVSSLKLPNPPVISWIFWSLTFIFYEIFTILSIVETRLKNYKVLLFMNSAQLLICISFFGVPLMQSASNYPLNFAFGYLVAMFVPFLIKK